jgi:hypothetical protein
MVKGLGLFREHFREYADRYVLIGGTACDLVMSEAGLDFRATKDLDIVLRVEALDRVFVEAFWTFVRDGKYQLQENRRARKSIIVSKSPKPKATRSCWSCSHVYRMHYHWPMTVT